MIDRVAGNKAMPASMWQEIIERADGIPLFIEEITKAVLEAGSQGASERIVAAIPSAQLQGASGLSSTRHGSVSHM